MNIQYSDSNEFKGTYTITFLVEHKRGNGTASVGAGAGLATNTNSGAALAVLILSTENGASGHQHSRVSGSDEEVEITKVVDGGTTSQWCSLYPFLVRTVAGPKRTDHLIQHRVQPHTHHRAPPLLCPMNQWCYECAPHFVILTHMMSLICQHISIYSSWLVICVVTAHGLCTRPALY